MKIRDSASRRAYGLPATTFRGLGSNAIISDEDGYYDNALRGRNEQDVKDRSIARGW